MQVTDLLAADPRDVAALAGLRVTHQRQGGVYLAPCPLCGRESAHERQGDQRGPIHLRDGWHCYGCGESGGRLDLLALGRLGRRWAELTRAERDGLLGSEAPSRRSEPAPPPPGRVPPELWAALVRACVPARRDAQCRAWAARRGLQLGGDLLAVVAGPCDLPLWTRPDPPARPRWIPDLGLRLLCPIYDETGLPVGARLRQVGDGQRKELGLPGFSSTGTCYASRQIREAWMRGEVPSCPVIVVEGKPDYLRAGMAWGRTHGIIGHFSGSFAGSWVQRLGPDVTYVHQVDAPDRQGRRQSDAYVAQFRHGCPHGKLLPVSRLYQAAGVAWEEGRDLDDLGAVVPSWVALQPAGG